MRGDGFLVLSVSGGKRVPKTLGGSTRRIAPVINSNCCCGRGSVSSFRSLGAYLLFRQSYLLVREFHFEARIGSSQWVLAGWQNMEMFSARVSVHPQYCCKVRLWSAQYKAPVLLFFPTSLIPLYYSAFAVRRSADEERCVWTIALIQYVYGLPMVVVNARNRSTPR